MTAFSDEELARLAKNPKHDISDLARELLQARRDVRRMDWLEAKHAEHSAMDVVGWLGTSGHQTIIDEKQRDRSRTAQITPQAGEADTITAAMSEAGDAVIVRWMNKNKDGKCFCPTAAEVYRAMRAAAPPRPVGPTSYEIGIDGILRKIRASGHCTAGDIDDIKRKYESLETYAANLLNTQFSTPAPAPKCDGNHAAPACADPECWQRPSPVAPVWQPIETAPRDGTRCLYYSPGRKGAGNLNARHPYCKVDAFSEQWPNAMHQLPEAPYTVWQPLPLPPDSPGTTEGS